MFEDEDMILPDDFQMDTPQSEEVIDTNETHVETVEDTKPTETTEQPVSPFLKVKYNHEEMDLDEMTAKELAQKGLNYDKTVERLQALESDPRLSFVEDLANQFGMNVPDYLEAVKQQREEERLNELLQANIPEEYAREMLENRKFRQEFDTERQTKAQEEKQNAEYMEFFDSFKKLNGRDFVNGQDEIPTNVWESNQNGVPLKYAYLEHHNQQLKAQLQTLKQNESNVKKAVVGSATEHGSTEVVSEDDFLKGFNSI